MDNKVQKMLTKLFIGVRQISYLTPKSPLGDFPKNLFLSLPSGHGVKRKKRFFGILEICLSPLFIVPLILLIPITFWGQDLSKEALVLTKNNSDKVVFLKTRKKIKVWTETGKVRGRLLDLRNDSLIIKNQVIALSDVVKIRANSIGAQIFGSVFMGTGGLFSITGLSILNSTSSGGCSTQANKIIGGILTTGGLIVTAAGASLFFIGKRYDCRKKWKLSSALVAD